MKARSVMPVGLLIVQALVIASTAIGCAHQRAAQSDAGWITLFDGTSLDDWQPIGDANWRLEGGAVQADGGSGFLVSKKAYANFQMRAEFWVDADANSGIFIRCDDPQKITATNSYEVNIFDKRPDPTYGTGAIVNVAKPATFLKAEGKWNTYEITAKGTQLFVTLNGIPTVKGIQDAKHASGPIALQYGAGVVKFRKVQIRPL